MRIVRTIMARSRRLITFGAALFSAAMLLLDGPVRSQENAPPPFGPPLQYASKPGQEFKALLAANVAWLQQKLTDRKRRRREAQNSFRLEPVATRPKVQAVIDQLDKEIQDTQAALAVVKVRSPDLPAQQKIVKANVEAWIKALDERAANHRQYAEEAEQKAKNAVKQLDAARYRLDADEYRQNSEKATNETKALADDLGKTGL